ALAGPAAAPARGGAGLQVLPSPLPCHAQPAPVHAEPVAGPSTTVVVVVRAVVVLELDAAGAPYAALTTTGQAPCRTDDWALLTGGPVPAPTVERVLAQLQQSGQGQEPWPSGVRIPLRTG
ncbi:MAG: hypothetical protein JWO60_1074, partial [Frankiales bacterium]|nr:hypothetical protein [Frankiales bacterium]